jgi:chemotaxis response regulator CheB
MSRSDDQEFLFPTSENERRELQELLAAAVDTVAKEEEDAKAHRATAKSRIEQAKKRVRELATLLRQSRPPKSREHRDEG